jgi:hypothetical protein
MELHRLVSAGQMFLVGLQRFNGKLAIRLTATPPQAIPIHLRRLPAA